MTNDYRKGAAYRRRTDANFRKRQKHGARIKAARRRLVKPGAKCQSRSSTRRGGPLELHHIGGDLTGRRGYRVFCRKHNREAAGQRLGRGKMRPGGRRA